MGIIIAIVVVYINVDVKVELFIDIILGDLSVLL